MSFEAVLAPVISPEFSEESAARGGKLMRVTELFTRRTWRVPDVSLNCHTSENSRPEKNFIAGFG